jgi:protein MpaA
MAQRPRVAIAAASALLGAGFLILFFGGGGEAKPVSLDAASAAGPTHGLDRRLRRLEQSPFRGPGRPRGWITVGHSGLGRPIRLGEFGATPKTRSPGRRVLVFGCIHGDECAASGLRPFKGREPCPVPSPVFMVPNLNPDGAALGTRLNGRGVDLNRNFPSHWKPIGVRGDLQYSGPHPFSEPESRLAARLIEAIHPDVTIWFHQEAKPMVRAWGPSVDAAKQYAEYSRLPFRRLPWLAGTAPNWQNHRFAGTASFVVELPPGPLSDREESAQQFAVDAMSFGQN